MAIEERDCCNCRYTDREEYEEPCKNCKNAINVLDSRYDNAPLLWESNIGSMVDHPSHYNQGDIECIDAMLAAYGKEAVNIFCLLNAFKYLWRAEHKNGKEDLNKAVWYLKKRLELCSDE